MMESKSETNSPEVTRREFVAGAVAAGVVATLPLAAGEARAAEAGDAAGVALELTVNGEGRSLKVDPRSTLLDVLRETLELSGTKKGCDHGQCGACTVLVDDRRVVSCLTLAAGCEGQNVTTIEGLAKGEQLHPLQQAFIEHDALQCGYCTPGQIMSAAGLIKEGHARNEADVKEMMSGNLCRCGAYPNICKAVMATQKAMGGFPL